MVPTAASAATFRVSTVYQQNRAGEVPDRKNDAHHSAFERTASVAEGAQARKSGRSLNEEVVFRLIQSRETDEAKPLLDELRKLLAEARRR